MLEICLTSIWPLKVTLAQSQWRHLKEKRKTDMSWCGSRICWSLLHGVVHYQLRDGQCCCWGFCWSWSLGTFRLHDARTIEQHLLEGQKYWWHWLYFALRWKGTCEIVLHWEHMLSQYLCFENRPCASLGFNIVNEISKGLCLQESRLVIFIILSTFNTCSLSIKLYQAT